MSDIKDIDKKVDKIIETTSRQDVQLERLTVISEQNKDILDKHIKRTEVNEDRIIQVETALVKHLSFIKGAIWIFGVASAAIGLLVKYKLI